jgi:hypothetical protein
VGRELRALVYSDGMKFRSGGQALCVAALLLGAPAAVGCAPYLVVQQSVAPSALKGVRDVTVSHDWTQARFSGKTEAEYVAEKTPEERADFEVVKAETDAAILSALREQVGAPYTFTPTSAPPGIGELRVVIRHAEVQTGVFSYVWNVPTKLLTRFIWYRDGKVTDIIDTNTTVAATMTTASDHQRMPIAGRNVGRAAAHYFVEAQHGK